MCLFLQNIVIMEHYTKHGGDKTINLTFIQVKIQHS